MQKRMDNPISKVLMLIGLLSIDVIGTNLLNTGGYFYELIIIPLISISSIWIVYILSEYLGIFSIDNVKITWKDILRTLKWYGISMIFRAVGMIILYFEGSLNTNNQELLNADFNSVPVTTIFILSVIAAPIMEELIVRGFIMKRCFNFDKNLGIVVSGLLFGLLHRPANFGSFFIYSSMGLILAIYYKKTNRLELAILLHMFSNSIGFIGLLF